MDLDKDLYEFSDIKKILKQLRGKDGCPWDKKQTVKTLSVSIEEELYELIDSLESGDPGNISEELGDVMFLIVFIANIFEENKKFSIKDVIQKNAEKLIRRHPHVFGDEVAETESDVLKKWEGIKRQERAENSVESILDSVPYKMPPLKKAYSVSDRTARNGFDWDDMDGVLKKVDEELDELKEAIKIKDKSEIEMEFGDLLFTLTNVARHAKIHPDTALRSSINKFENRFRYMEKSVKKNGNTLETISRSEIDKEWNLAKDKFK
ncbi:MAG: nucleoside triphosphate pyrophosphohydrolase [Desulfobacterales bacterium]|nr:nucleoside triphosphate pyrophosphohydrolase [Desulfobacterales bacterium]MCP4159970.1 nucleoside triphosphate pyrophosphohydrolase [Deltaproteobacteria bacterium]